MRDTPAHTQPGTAAATPALMVQGTCSNAGKSLLTAALCRIFAQDGLHPAPFKAQNMGLNSFVTDDGREIGRAQALQAAACGRAPDARMNPVLLKPASDVGSQVLLLGRPVRHMRVQEYLDFKPTAWKTVVEAYASLAREADVMVLEGAGSPAETNLKAHDIVNMAMARHARAKVLLVADIDRGGAFAALYGTWALLEPDERAHIAGFLLNKFRGDASLLTPALEDIYARTGVPVLGVIPWLRELNLPEEDSVSFRLYGPACAPYAAAGAAQGDSANTGPCLDIALLDLPHLSNITDFDPLRLEPDVRLRLARRPEDLTPVPDAIILPGSKNTPADLRRLHDSGMADAVRRAAQAGAVVIGICGGLQMLGQAVHDPLGLESGTPCTLPGLGLLPLATEIRPHKTLCRQQARHADSGLAVTGYEIHHGVTTVSADTAPATPTGTPPGPLGDAFTDAGGRALGWQSADAAVWGTYLHGVFDADAFRRHFCNTLRARKGWPPLPAQATYTLADGLDRLADAVRASLDMANIYALLGLEPRP